MATSPIQAYRAAHEAEIPFRVRVVTPVARIEPTLDADKDDSLGAARGILFGLLLCVAFWLGVYAVLF